MATSDPCVSSGNVTDCGLCPKAFSPRAVPSLFAGSIVMTMTFLPETAAWTANAAAVVVLPTPPDPAHMTMRFSMIFDIVHVTAVFLP